MSGREITTIICARNAANTIARAVRSAAAQCDRILLVDDFSSDDTISRARAVAPVEIVSPPHHGTMGETRQCGLDAVTTPLLVWLDADDEFLPGRVEQLVERLHDHELASDGVEIVDGLTNAARGTAVTPAFVRRAPVRLFERMYLPGPGVIAAQTAFARCIGYDEGLHGCEDVDFLLRAIANGGRLAFVEDMGYRLHAYPTSLSRDRDRQRRMYRATLEKHAYDDVRALYLASGVPAVVTAWALVSMAMFREDYMAALRFIAEAEVFRGTHDDSEPEDAEPEVVEPDGPCPFPESWRIAFSRGTALLLLQDTPAACDELERARHLIANAETLNNLGVAYARRGERSGANSVFEQAVALRPEYADARENLAADAPSRITTHPLRVETARQDYRARCC
jgi:glycosyltransferase involved in cell wall biosynthesis